MQKHFTQVFFKTFPTNPYKKPLAKNLCYKNHKKPKNIALQNNNNTNLK